MKAGEALNSEKSLRSATAEKVLKPLKHGCGICRTSTESQM